MDCCDTVVKLGCYYCDDNVDISVATDETGDHEVEVQFNGQVYVKTVSLTSGNNVIFDTTDLNENYTFKARVRKPSGVYLNSNCYQFSLMLKDDL